MHYFLDRCKRGFRSDKVEKELTWCEWLTMATRKGKKQNERLTQYELTEITCVHSPLTLFSKYEVTKIRL